MKWTEKFCVLISNMKRMGREKRRYKNGVRNNKKKKTENFRLMPQNKGRDQGISLIIKCNKLFRHAIKERRKKMRKRKKTIPFQMK